MATYHFNEIGRLPLPGDNVAIATRRLEAGTEILYENQRFALDYTLLEGHRFALQPIQTGAPLLSWLLPFGYATRLIQPGSYVINGSALDALRGRTLDFNLPDAPNFIDKIERYKLDEGAFRPAPPTPRYAEERTFLGYRRSAARGVGTRNFIVVLGTTSRTGSFARQLAARLQGAVKAYPNIDGIVPVAHTEGGVEHPNNLEFMLRTLAGFMVHPNVGAVLAVDYGVEPVTNAMLRDYLVQQNYPLDDLPHHFLSLTGGFQENLAKGEGIVQGWLGEVSRTQRTPQSLAHLKIALQCGGSDAFSGISGNPLLGWMAHELVRYGGSAALAETDELIGAESYVLDKVRDLATAQRFLELMEEFKERAAWHGADAEGNPSGGNKYRGLYNIVLKSIGAARKKDPATRLDYTIPYAVRMTEPGFYFMDSPGNDLEGIAGQVAAGNNLIIFVTGNGSITNFPFVPTIKIVTTTRRYELLSQDMDINAGAYLDGVLMEQLGRQSFEQMIRIVSGQHSVGEKAGHAQVQLWRNWQQTDSSNLDRLLNAALPNGVNIPIQTAATSINFRVNMVRNNGRQTTDQIGLILPTSLCAGQIADMTARRLNQKRLGQQQGLSRFVALSHTEGCGASGGANEKLYARTMMGYLSHPLVKHCLLLEHGCERTHNDYMRHEIQAMGIDPGRIGFASIQLDGGIEKVMEKVEKWFSGELTQGSAGVIAGAGLEALRLGIATDGPLSDGMSATLAQLTKQVVTAGGSVVLPENTGLLSSAIFRNAVLKQSTVLPSLAYGEHSRMGGFHIMETPTEHWVETLTGLAATGVELVLTHVGNHPLQTHPLIPVIQFSAEPTVSARYAIDLDLALQGDPTKWLGELLNLVKRVIEHEHAPRLYQQGNIDFQLTRGLLGVTL